MNACNQPTMNDLSIDPKEKVNVLTLKWGTRYGSDFVNKLYKAVTRNLTLPFRFVCFTDDSNGLDQGIESFPIPEIDLQPPERYLGWRKLCLFRDDLPLEGKCLFLDLDILITGNLDVFFSYEPDKIPIIRN